MQWEFYRRRAESCSKGWGVYFLKNFPLQTASVWCLEVSMHTPEHTPKRLAAFLFALFLGASGSFAQTTWTGGGDGTTWSQTNN